MSLRSIIFSSAVFVLCCISCVQRPDAQKFAAPELGELKIVLQDFNVRLNCAVSGESDGMKAGFIFGKKFGEAGRDTFVVSILDGGISCSFDNLEPNTSYSVQAFIRSGQNEILSPEEVFTTRAINIATDVKSITLPATDPGEYTLVLHARNELGYWTTPDDSVKCGFVISFDYKNPTIETEEVWIHPFTLPCSQKDYLLKIDYLDLDLPVYFRSYLIADGNYIYGEVMESHTLKTIDFNFSNIQIEPLGLSSVKVTGRLEYNLHDPVDESLCIYAYAGNDIEKAIDGCWTECFQPDEGHHNFSHVFENLDSDTDLYLSLHAGFIDHEFEPTEPILFRTLSEKDFGEPVDLGLSVLWRSCNIGARTPEETGVHYKWGARNIAAEGWWYDEYCTEPETLKYNSLGGKTTLDLEDDIAHIKLGGKWRMPTAIDFKQLSDHCDIRWQMQGDNLGLIFISRIPEHEGKSIFFPVYEIDEWGSGDLTYWSSSLVMNPPIWNPDTAYSFHGESYRQPSEPEYINALWLSHVHCEGSVRPVMER